MWILEGSCSAVFESFSNAASHAVGARASTAAIAWWTRLAATSLAFIFFVAWRGELPSPPASSAFWIPMTVSATFNTAATLMYVRALRHDLALAVPITGLSPVFLLASEPLMTGIFVPPLGVVGVLVIGFGLYIQNADALRTHGWLGPFKHVWRSPGPRLMLGVVLIWAFTAPLDKIAIGHCDPLFYAIALQGGIGLLLTPLFIRDACKSEKSASAGWRLGLIGLLTGGASILQMSALAQAPATFVVALRRFSSPLSALWGWLIFKEPHARVRLLGALLMTAGAVLMLLSL